MTYEVEITPEGLRHFNRLPAKVKAAVVEAIFGTIAENPRRAGKPLRGELAGLYSARRGEFRLIYEIDEEAKGVLVHRAQHREGPTVADDACGPVGRLAVGGRPQSRLLA